MCVLWRVLEDSNPKIGKKKKKHPQMYYLQRAIWFECRQTYRQEDIEQTNEQRWFKLDFVNSLSSLAP